MTPVLNGANVSASKSFRKYLNNKTGKREVKELQQSTVLGTAHVLRKVLMQECKRLIVGNTITCLDHKL